MKKYNVIALVLALVLILSSCATPKNAKAKSEDLLKDVDTKDVEVKFSGDEGESICDFGIRLIKKSRKQGENIVISPFSIVSALTMTANGAAGETLKEMEEVLGGSAENLSGYFHNYNSKKDEGIGIANAIWFKDSKSLKMNPEFMKKSKAYFGSGIYKAPFDKTTKDEINGWVSNKTGGMIPKILEKIPDNAIIYLVNALSFKKEWAEPYPVVEISDTSSDSYNFTTESGEIRKAIYLYSDENYFLEDDKAIGFMKHYKGNRYAFVALLPNKGITLSEYIDALNGAKLSSTLKNAKSITVNAKLPKFKHEYKNELNEVLKEMGIKKAFKGADFKNMAVSADNIAISRVIHKSFIDLNESGTSAAAVTVVEMKEGSKMVEETKTVNLDRPFLYMIYDTEENVPLFIGTVEDFK